MNTYGNFVPLETVEPEMARQWLPMRFFVSAKTFAEAAEAVDKRLHAESIPAALREEFERQDQFFLETLVR